MKRIKKIGFLILILITIVLAACAGGRHKIQNGKIYNDEGLLQGDYALFDGTYYKTIDLKEGNRIVFGYAVGTMSGELTAYFGNRNGGNKIKIEDSLIYEIKESGSYRIEVVGNNHSGAFAIEWELD
ncbi:MAG TPA: hypothetical protein DCG34_05295 [Clostridiales bacterium]|jgi:hypothetical protein|nr:hypothetical protein [Clostridiales bacterium]